MNQKHDSEAVCMEENSVNLPHTLFIDNRSRITLTGVSDVGSFNEELIHVSTALGDVSITGEALQVTKLDLQSGEVQVEGKIISLSYAEMRTKGTLFSRMFS